MMSILNMLNLIVTCNNQLQWSEHSYNVANRANRTLGIVRRVLKPSDAKVKLRAYESLIRPQLDYASAAWSPYSSISLSRFREMQLALSQVTVGAPPILPG